MDRVVLLGLAVGPLNTITNPTILATRSATPQEHREN